MIKCCKGCDDRRVGCHSSCSRYIQEKTEALEARMKQKRECKVDYDIHSLKKRKRSKK